MCFSRVMVVILFCSPVLVFADSAPPKVLAYVAERLANSNVCRRDIFRSTPVCTQEELLDCASKATAVISKGVGGSYELSWPDLDHMEARNLVPTLNSVFIEGCMDQFHNGVFRPTLRRWLKERPLN